MINRFISHRIIYKKQYRRQKIIYTQEIQYNIDIYKYREHIKGIIDETKIERTRIYIIL